MNLSNWRTTVFGSLALAAAFLTQYPDLLSTIFDPAVAKKIAAVAALLSGLIAFANAKDKQVSGNGTVSNPTQVAQPDGSNKIVAPLLLLALLPAVALTSCDTLTAWQANPKVQFAETEAIKLAAAYFANGGDVDAAWGVSNGLNIISDVANFAVDQQTANAKLKQAAKDYSGNPAAVTGLANGIVKIVDDAAPQTPAEKAKLVQVVASGIQQAAAAAQRGDGKAVAPTQVRRGSVPAFRISVLGLRPLDAPASLPPARETPSYLRLLYTPEERPLYPLIVTRVQE